MKCEKCGNSFWLREEDGLVCIYCGYIDCKPIAECVVNEVKRKGGYLPREYIFFRVGKAKAVFEALEREAIMEQRFGRVIEPISVSKN